MSKIRPQVIYNPEGELIIRTDLKEDLKDDSIDIHDLILKEKYDHLALMTARPGVVVSEDQEAVEIRVEVAERFADSFEGSDHDDINSFLKNLNKILPFNPQDKIDRVFSIQHLFWGGAEGIVNEHFQRWMNTGLTEEAARHGAVAMALPFGQEVVEDTKDDFTYRSVDGHGAEADAYSSRIVVAQTQFGLYKTSQTPNTHLETTGNVIWGSLLVSTLGNCACWSAMGSDRENVNLGSENKALYDLDPHNIDSAKQSLSVLLGVSSLAYYASLYTGTEDILAKAEWGETREYPIR